VSPERSITIFALACTVAESGNDIIEKRQVQVKCPPKHVMSSLVTEMLTGGIPERWDNT